MGVRAAIEEDAFFRDVCVCEVGTLAVGFGSEEDILGGLFTDLLVGLFNGVELLLDAAGIVVLNETAVKHGAEGSSLVATGFV